MRIVILGSSGRVGGYLLPHLRSCGHEVLGWSRSSGGDLNVDATNLDQVGFTLDRLRPEAIVNLAAQTNIDECEASPQSAYLVNVKIVENLVHWIENNDNSSHLVQISTDQIYDSPGPHKEDDTSLKNYYGFSKYVGEVVATKVNSTILRTNFFGQSRSLGRLSFSDWLVDSLIKEEKITVFDDVFFSPLSLQTLVEMLEIVIVKRKNGTFNLGSREGMSKAEFAFYLAKVLGLPVKKMTKGGIGTVNLTANRAKDMRMDSSSFEEVFEVELPTLRQEIETLKGTYSYEAR